MNQNISTIMILLIKNIINMNDFKWKGKCVKTCGTVLKQENCQEIYDESKIFETKFELSKINRKLDVKF